MITLTASGNSIVFAFSDSKYYLYGTGTITVPKNSLALITDDSDFATFKKADSNDIFVTAPYADFGKTKAELISFYEDNMVGGSVDPEDVIDIVESGTTYIDGAVYVSSASTIYFYHGENVVTSIDASDFVIDGMVDNVSIQTISGASYLVIDFNTASGKEDIQIPLTDIFNPDNYYDKTAIDGIVSGINETLSGKQDTLSAGTNITISGNVISAEGGKAIEAGRGKTVTTGATADTVSVNLPISAGTGNNSLVLANNGYGIGQRATEDGAVAINGSAYHPTYATGQNSLAQGTDTHAQGIASHSEGTYTYAIGFASHSEGGQTSAFTDYSHAEGQLTKTSNSYEHTSGRYNVSSSASTTFGDSGNTLFSVGNGTANNARHNAFEIRQNGDIYISSGGTDILLQDHLGGGGGGGNNTVELTQAQYDALVSGGTVDPSTYYIITDAQSVDISQYWTSAQTDSAITSAVSGKVDTSAITSSVTSGSTDVITSGGVYDQLGGLKLVKISQTDYDNLQVKDSNTLYVITDN